MVIDLPVLLREIHECGVQPHRLHVDRNAIVIGPEDREAECGAKLGQRIGSTLTGTGAATARKVLRNSDVALASSAQDLRPYLVDVAKQLNERLDNGEVVIVEGSQGFGLSLHHSGSYPFATSRDTTAAGFLSEVGLSPRLVTDIFLVLRTYPIRVSGNSGPLQAELDWDTVKTRAGYRGELAEYTTVTGRLRRVGEFDWDLAARAIQVNRPTGIALHGADYINFGSFGKSSWDSLTEDVRMFVGKIETQLGVHVDFIFTGPAEHEIIDRRRNLSPYTAEAGVLNGYAEALLSGR